MTKIHIHSNGETRGPFDVDDVNFLLQEGKLSPSDHGCVPGGRKWQSLDSPFFAELGIRLEEQEQPAREEKVVSTSAKNEPAPEIPESSGGAAGFAGSLFKKAKAKLKPGKIAGKLDSLVDKVKSLPKNLVSNETSR